MVNTVIYVPKSFRWINDFRAGPPSENIRIRNARLKKFALDRVLHAYGGGRDRGSDWLPRVFNCWKLGEDIS